MMDDIEFRSVLHGVAKCVKSHALDLEDLADSLSRTGNSMLASRLEAIAEDLTKAANAAVESHRQETIAEYQKSMASMALMINAAIDRSERTA